MARVFITGSTDGLGAMAARLLMDEGNRVVLHARNAARADDARSAMPEAEAIVTGDLASIDGMRDVAQQVNRFGRFDAVIHNAGIGYREPRRVETVDGLPQVFAINALAPYVLTASIEPPQPHVYLGSGMHHGSRANLDDIAWTQRAWSGAHAYAESKFMDVLLALAVARYWPDVFSNALEPGWVPTKMGGPSAPDDLNEAHRTQAWLAVSDDAEARVSGRYFFHMRERACDPEARDEALQDEFIALCERLSGVNLER